MSEDDFITALLHFILLILCLLKNNSITKINSLENTNDVK